MMTWLRRYRNAIFIGTVAVFLISIFVGLGGYLFTGVDNAEAVAVVGGTKISYAQFQNRVSQYLDAMREEKKGEVTDDMVRQVKMEMLRDMIVDEILAQEAAKLGIQVTDLELAFQIKNNKAFQSGGQYSEGLYFQYVRRQLRTTPEDYERQLRRTMLAGKLKQLIFGSAKLTPGELTDDSLKAEYKRRNGGSDKDFAKHKDEIIRALHQSRALELINFYLKQLSSQMEIVNYLDKREQGG